MTIEEAVEVIAKEFPDYHGSVSQSIWWTNDKIDMPTVRYRAALIKMTKPGFRTTCVGISFTGFKEAVDDLIWQMKKGTK